LKKKFLRQALICFAFRIKSNYVFGNKAKPIQSTLKQQSKAEPILLRLLVGHCSSWLFSLPLASSFLSLFLFRSKTHSFSVTLLCFIFLPLIASNYLSHFLSCFLFSFIFSFSKQQCKSICIFQALCLTLSLLLLVLFLHFFYRVCRGFNLMKQDYYFQVNFDHL